MHMNGGYTVMFDSKLYYSHLQHHIQNIKKTRKIFTDFLLVAICIILMKMAADER